MPELAELAARCQPGVRDAQRCRRPFPMLKAIVLAAGLLACLAGGAEGGAKPPPAPKLFVGKAPGGQAGIPGGAARPAATKAPPSPAKRPPNFVFIMTGGPCRPLGLQLGGPKMHG
jgi:hypothetical protein